MNIQTGMSYPNLQALRKLHKKISGLNSRQRLATAVLLGVLAALALPPLYLVPLLIPAFSLLLWLGEGAKNRKDWFLLGWAFGVGWFFAGLYWVGIAMTVDLANFWWFIPISVLGLALGLGLFPGLALWLTSFAPANPLSRLFALAAAWLVMEYVRSWFLTGFPWNLIGTVWAFSHIPLQIASLAGVWGLCLLTLLAAGAPSLLVSPKKNHVRLGIVFSLGLPVLILAFGLGRLGLAEKAGSQMVEDVRLRLVQPAIPQSLKWDPAIRAANVVQQVELSKLAGSEAITHFIWAETAVPYALNISPDILSYLSEVPNQGGLLITGALSVEGTATDSKVFNSLVAINAGGEIVSRYDKHHLVPFGEYVPFRKWLPIDKITAGLEDFTAGKGPKALSLLNIPIAAPLICYEVIFPGNVTPANTRPGWLLNVTNDAWFGLSSGPYQHFASARMRAVEEGLPLVRVANNGISAVVDPYGRILDKLTLDKIGIIDSGLPKAISTTIYARLDNFAVLGLSILALIGVFAPLYRK